MQASYPCKWQLPAFDSHCHSAYFETAADEPDLAAGAYIAFIAVLGLGGAAVAYGFLSGRRSRRLLLLARLGAAALLLGVVVGIGRWIAEGSLGGDGAGGIVITAYFLLGGVLYAQLARAPHHSRE